MTRWLFPRIRKKDPLPPWTHTFFIAWAGMRGGISLAAAMAVPTLYLVDPAINYRDLLVFLVFCTIIVTLLLQGLALPWVFTLLGLKNEGNQEQTLEHRHLLMARQSMVDSVLKWLQQFRKEKNHPPTLYEEIKLRINEYQYLSKNLHKLLSSDPLSIFLEDSLETKKYILHNQIVEIEKNTLIELWQAKKISHTVKSTLLLQLDYRAKQFT